MIPVSVSEYFVQTIGFNGNWIATFAISPVAPVVIYILSLLRLAKQDRQMILNALEKSTVVEGSLLPSELVLERASIASYLHNTLQSELLALSRQLEVAASGDDPIRSAELLERVSSRVNRSIVEDFKQFSQSPLERLDLVISSWQGILDIKIDFPKELLADNRKHATIVQAIEEVATNISRYDVASELQVTADLTNGSVVLKFQSNGQGKLVKSRGIGSAWLSQIAVSEWSIEKNKTGTLLTIEI